MSPVWSPVVWALLAALALAGLGVAAAASIRRFKRLRKTSLQRPPLAIIKRRFHLQRERLEAKFVQLAATSADAATRRWAECSFADDVAYVQSRATGEFAAFVAVTIAPSDLEAAGYALADPNRTSQAGTAIFRFDRDHWETDGRAIRNLTPAEAVRQYRNEFVVVSQEVAPPA